MSDKKPSASSGKAKGSSKNPAKNGHVKLNIPPEIPITNVTETNPKKRGRAPRNLLLASTAIGAVGYGAWQAGRTRFNSKITGKLDLKGLQKPVEVIRDKWGIPHLYAESLSDLAFAQGFVQAQDRLWQMEFQRRLASGRLAEVLGEPVIFIDKQMRRLQLRRAAHNDYAHLDPQSEEKMVLDRLAEGINAFINTKKLPLEFSILRYKPETWSAIDSLTWAKMMAVAQSTNLDTELVRAQVVQAVGAERAAQLEPTRTLTGRPLIVPPGADYSGINLEKISEDFSKLKIALGALTGGNSNNWVISGKKTESGKPYLCNDPHMSVLMPGTWYEMHLHAPDLEVIGVSIPGVPLIIIGHNQHIAWGVTNTMADFQDSFIEKVDPANPRRYEHKGEWKDFEFSREEIKIKGKPSIFEEYARSVHGPVLNSFKVGGNNEAADASSPNIEAPLSVSWSIYEPATGVKSILGLSRARNWEEFRTALSFWDMPSLSFVYADVTGNIGYQFTGNIPIRGKGLGLVPSPGHTGEYDWQGYIPFEELPRSYNPEQGYIITTNQKVVDNDYPYWLGSDYLGENRAERLRQLITSKEKLSLDDMARFQIDQLSLPGMRLARRLVQIDTAGLNDLQRRALGYLAIWDGNLNAQSIAGCLYEVTLQKLSRLVFEPILGKATEGYLGNTDNPLAPINSLQCIAFSFLIDQIEANDQSLLPPGKSWDSLLTEALTKAISWLQGKLGNEINGWEWGKLHQLTYSHPLGAVKPLDRIFNRGPYPVGGDWDTVWQMGYSSANDNFAFNGASSAIRLIADLSDWEKTRFGTTSGQGGSPFSPHYADFIDDWLTGQHHPHYFKRASILEHAEGKLTLNPAT